MEKNERAMTLVQRQRYLRLQQLSGHCMDKMLGKWFNGGAFNLKL